MKALPRKRMTADEFIFWAMQRPEGERYELVDGEVVAMSPERASHGRSKFEIALALREAIAAPGLGCEVFIDGMAVRIDDDTVYEPDALVRCGNRLDDEATEVTDPVILVEVVSPGTHKVDTSVKLDDYFRLPSLRHYLIVNTRRRVVRHHWRSEEGRILSRILGEGTLELDPPGLSIPLQRFFAG